MDGDNYITKPFSLKGAVARIRAVLRRTHPPDAGAAILTYGDLELSEEAYNIRRASQIVELPLTEFKLLRYLLINAERVMSKVQIPDHVWDYNWNGEIPIVEPYTSYLRRKIDSAETLGIINPEEAKAIVSLVHAKRGIGYVLRSTK